MNTKHLIHAAIIFAVMVLLAPAVAQADPLVFTLNNANQSGTQGQTLTFNATVSNSGTSSPTALTINGDSFTAAPNTSLNDTFYFTNFDGRVLTSGSSFTGPLFTVMINNNAPNGIFSGSFTIFYDGTSPQQPVTQDFRVTVGAAPGAVPEPATVMLLGTGLGGIMALRRKQRRSHEVSQH